MQCTGRYADFDKFAGTYNFLSLCIPAQKSTGYDYIKLGAHICCMCAYIKDGCKDIAHVEGSWRRPAANYCSAQSSHRNPQPVLSSKRGSHFKTHKCPGKNKNMEVGPDGAPKQRIAAMAKARSKLLLCSLLLYTISHIRLTLTPLPWNRNRLLVAEHRTTMESV
jgi:hypothetical protein